MGSSGGGRPTDACVADPPLAKRGRVSDPPPDPVKTEHAKLDRERAEVARETDICKGQETIVFMAAIECAKI